MRRPISFYYKDGQVYMDPSRSIMIDCGLKDQKRLYPILNNDKISIEEIGYDNCGNHIYKVTGPVRLISSIVQHESGLCLCSSNGTELKLNLQS